MAKRFLADEEAEIIEGRQTGQAHFAHAPPCRPCDLLRYGRVPRLAAHHEIPPTRKALLAWQDH